MYRNGLRMYRSRTAKNTCTEMDVVCTEVVMYRKCPPLCTETVICTESDVTPYTGQRLRPLKRLANFYYKYLC